jgi:hypothetical protein
VSRERTLGEGVFVVVPTMSLRRMKEGFHQRVLDAVPGAKVVYALNGPGSAELAATPAAPGCRLVATRPGFNRAVIEGLRAALTFGAHQVVRMDAEEHPPEALGNVLPRLGPDDTEVIDLAFVVGETLVPRSTDSYHNLYVIPALIETYARDGLRITGAHGFMAFGAPVLAVLLPFVEAALDAAEQAGRTPLWGADTLLPVCAAQMGFPVRVTHTPAEKLRDRDEEKCNAQLQDTLSLLKALAGLRLDGVKIATAGTT